MTSTTPGRARSLATELRTQDEMLGKRADTGATNAARVLARWAGTPLRPREAQQAADAAVGIVKAKDMLDCLLAK